MSKTHGAAVVIRRDGRGYRWRVMDGEVCVGHGWCERKLDAISEARAIKRKYLKMGGGTL